jgi:hypothetical protein
MKKLNGLKLIFRINVARRKLKQMTTELARCENRTVSDGHAVKRANEALTVVQARYVAGEATLDDVRAALGVLVRAMSACQQSSDALHLAIARCKAASRDLDSISDEALKAVA